MIAGIIIGSLVTIIIMVMSVFKLNSYCEEKYEYTPFSLGKAFLMLGAIVLVVVGVYIFMMPHLGVSGGEYVDTRPFNVNAIVCGVCAAIIALLLFIRISIKTNIFIGAYATFLLLIGSVIVVVLVFFREGGKFQPTIRG